MRLSNRFRRGLQWSAFSALATSGLQFLQLLILARLLDKADFGIFATASLFFYLLLQIQETALNNTILHRQESDHRQLSVLFWANLLLGVLLGGLLWLAGGLLSVWYGEPVVAGVLHQLAPLLPLLGAASIFKVLHQQQMNYRQIGRVEMIASAVSFAVALWLAFSGQGVQALVGAAIARHGTEAFLFWVWKPLLRPSGTFRLEEGRFYLRHGFWQTGERFVTLLTAQLDTLLIGKLLGMEALGVYDVLKRLLVRPSSLLSHIVERVALPLYARIQQRKPVLKKIFSIMVQRLATLHFFGYGLLMVLADFMLPLLLGKAWAEHTTVFRLVAGFVFLHCLLNPVDSLLVATGNIQRWLWSNLLLLAPLATAIFWGCQFGLAGAVWAQILVLSLFFLWVYQVVLGKRYGWNWAETGRLLGRSIRPAVLPLALAAALLPLMKMQAWWWVMVAVVATGWFLRLSGVLRWGRRG